MDSALKINIVSFNLTNTNKTLSADAREVLQFDPDIHIEATQEDQRPLDKNSIFGSELANKGFDLFDMVSLNHKPTDMNVVLRVYMKKNIHQLQGTSEHKKGKHPLALLNGIKGTALLEAQAAADYLSLGKGFSKGAVWIKIYKPYPILFINMHLPILKSKGDKGLGYEFRSRALKEILTNKDISDLVTPDTTVFLTGDMNFRINPDQHNQLTNLLNSDIPFLQELDFLRQEDKVITCKFEKDKGEACKDARKIMPVVPGGPPMAKGLEKCVSEKRTPSRCDRILFHKGNRMSLKVLQHKGSYLLDLSDHNALFATVELKISNENTISPSWGTFKNPMTHNIGEIVNINDENIYPDNGRIINPRNINININSAKFGGFLVAKRNVKRTRRRKQKNKTRKSYK
jgi:hypothetical protein